MGTNILIALGTASTRQSSNRLQHLHAQFVGLLALGLVAHDLQGSRHANLAGAMGSTLSLQGLAVGRNPLDDEVDRRNLIEQQIKALLRRTPDRFETAGSHPQWWMRLLDRARFDNDILKMPTASVI